MKNSGEFLPFAKLSPPRSPPCNPDGFTSLCFLVKGIDNGSGDKDDVFHLEETDKDLPSAWKSGSLKYGELKPLSEGGTAKLYLARDKNLRRTVAYKTLHDDLRDDEVEARRFLREARVTANIQHPGTVPVYELGRDRSGHLFFTMKKVEGRDLRAILLDVRQEVPEALENFPLPRLLDVLIQVCQTVAYAHEHGVIHRDLKPANVLVGEFGEVVVIDWGLAKVLAEEDEPEEDKEPSSATASSPSIDPCITPAGKNYGTPMYMPPEIAWGETALDGRVDVFSLGVILYEILADHFLVEGETAKEVIGKILHEPFPLPRETAPAKNLPRDLQAICMKAISKDKRKRYPTVRALLEDLRRYRHGEEVSVYWYSGWEKLNRWNHKHALATVAALAAALGYLAHLLFGG